MEASFRPWWCSTRPGHRRCSGLPRSASWAPSVLPAALVGGVAGVALDSLLGATLQAIFWCPRCGAETERRFHACGTATIPLRGWRWLNNDAVNALSSVGGAAVAMLV